MQPRRHESTKDSSVRRGQFRAIDDQQIDRPTVRFVILAELRLQRRKPTLPRVVWRLAGSPEPRPVRALGFELNVIGSGEASLIDDDAPGTRPYESRELRHRRAFEEYRHAVSTCAARRRIAP